MTEPSLPQSRILAASYNIHSCRGTDGRYDPDRVAGVIREIDPDIIGLQEVESGYWTGSGENQLDLLAQATGLHAVSGPTLQSARGHYGNAILTRWPVQDVRRIDLSVPGREPRGALDVCVRIDDQPLRMLVTHFGLAATERFAQAGALIGLLRDGRAGIRIVAGDFNEWASRRKTIRMLDEWFGDSGSVRTWPSRFPLFALDRIWVHPGKYLIDLRPHRSKQARHASDHLPLTARLSWSPLRQTSAAPAKFA